MMFAIPKILPVPGRIFGASVSTTTGYPELVSASMLRELSKSDDVSIGTAVGVWILKQVQHDGRVLVLGE